MIDYRRNVPLATDDVIRVFAASGIVRPTQDPARIERMFAAADLVISAWSHDELVGVCRSLTDFCYCCYLSDLAVAASFQRHGIGTRLIAETRKSIGDEVTLILLSNANAVAYYPKVGFEKAETAFVIRRQR